MILRDARDVSEVFLHQLNGIHEKWFLSLFRLFFIRRCFLINYCNTIFLIDPPYLNLTVLQCECLLESLPVKDLFTIVKLIEGLHHDEVWAERQPKLKLELHLLLVHKLLQTFYRLLERLVWTAAHARDKWVTILVVRGRHSRPCISLLIKELSFISLFYKAWEGGRAIVLWSWVINLTKSSFFDLGNRLLLLLLHLILNHGEYLKQLHGRLELSLLSVVVVCPCISSNMLKVVSYFAR